MRKRVTALLAILCLSGVVTADIQTNLVQNFDGAVDAAVLYWTGSSEYDPLTDQANNVEILGGTLENRWAVGESVVTNNGVGRMVIRSSQNKWRNAMYTITADQFSGATPSGALSFEVIDLWNSGVLEAKVYSIFNPGTPGNAVTYNVLSATELTVSGAAYVNHLATLTVGGLANNDVPEVQKVHTLNFAYNGIDDVVVVFNVVGTSGADKAAVIDDIMVTTDMTAELPANDETIIASFEDTFTDADRSFFGVDAQISGGAGVNSTYGSSDTSYGSVLGGAELSGGSLKINKASESQLTPVVTVTNNSANQIILESLNFDVIKRYNLTPGAVEVSISGDVSGGVILSSAEANNFTVSNVALSDYDDFDVDLTNLADHTLEPGEGLQITFAFINDQDGSSDTQLDNIALIGSQVKVTQLVTDPAGPLELQLKEGTASSSVDVSYDEASVMPTNVAVTSISVVNQSDDGFSVSSSSFTLSDPGDIETVSITFDNGIAGLTAGQTATGQVQFIWNEVGSVSSSIYSMPVSVTYLEVNDENTLAVFEHTGDYANPVLQGLDAVISSGYGSSDNSIGSADGTFGSLSGNARTDGGCYRASLTYPVISVAVTNNTGFDCTLESFHFDAAKMWAKGCEDITVSISGDVTAVPVLTNYVGLTQFNGVTGDYDDIDIDLSGLADRTLAHGEVALIELTVSNGDLSNSNAVTAVDNIALLGSGTAGAELIRVPGGRVGIGVTGSDTTVAEAIAFSYEEGEFPNSISITSVSFTDETHPGSFGVSGTFPVAYAVPDETNTAFSVVFDNSVANLAAGAMAEATVSVIWNENGLADRTSTFTVFAARPENVPEAGVVALFDTLFLTPDAAMEGILGKVEQGFGLDTNVGSNDGDYGTLATPVAPADAAAWAANISNTVITVRVTNKSAGAIELSSFHFDVGRRWIYSLTNFTLSVSGDVTADPALLEVTGLPQLSGNLADFEDFDVALTNLADHTLGIGEFIIFTFTFETRPDALVVSTLIDNLLLKTDLDAFGVWAVNHGLTIGLNDSPADNPDGDNKDNLMEYATNGDPLNPDEFAEMWIAEDGGIDWFYHVHLQRTDDPALTFSLGAKDNLVITPVWDASALQFVGESEGVDGFKSVTNRTDMGTAEFIRLKVDQN